MKIKDLMALDQTSIREYDFLINEVWFCVRKNDTYYIDFSMTNMSSDEIIAHLALLGIEVEFKKEITISQNDYNWLVAMDFNERMLKKTVAPFRKCVTVGIENIPFTDHLFNDLEPNKEYLVSDLLKFRIEG
jgi:hypothetical protein